MSARSTISSTSWKHSHVWFFLVFVVVLSYLTYFHRYWFPAAVFWDENYHIASAQKYLHGIFFMEQHPPLGKLLIALGEVLLHPNQVTSQFLGTDYGTDFGEGFSFAGYRLFSALSGWLTAPVIFLIFLILLRNPLQSTLLSFLYIFDNAIIVQVRGAMLEGPLMFFCALMILFFVLLLRDKERIERIMLWSALLGLSFALIVTTKVLGLIFILFFPVVFWQLFPKWNRILISMVCAAIPFLIVYCTVWEIHFALGKTVNADLPDNGYYQASEEYKEYIAAGRTNSLAGFPVMLRDSLAYVPFYNRGAPRLDLCKMDENGSPFYFWPLGARTINFRWETPDSQAYRYLYLVPNPVVWWGVLFSLFIGASLLLTSFISPSKTPLKRPLLLGTFIGIYLAFMIGVSRIDRVLYLYHYFIPLLLSMIVFALVFDEIRTLGKTVLTEYGKTMMAFVIAAVVFMGHQYYRPFTYYEPLTDAQFNRRNIFGLWEMHCVNCPKVSGLVVPNKEP